MTPTIRPAPTSFDPRREVEDIAALKRKLANWHHQNGEGPFTLREVGRIVNNDFDVAREYFTPDGICFFELFKESFITQLAALHEWDLVEEILDMTPDADWAEQLSLAKFEQFESMESILKDLGIK